MCQRRRCTLGGRKRNGAIRLAGAQPLSASDGIRASAADLTQSLTVSPAASAVPRMRSSANIRERAQSLTVRPAAEDASFTR